jgi:hypothetical protein
MATEIIDPKTKTKLTQSGEVRMPKEIWVLCVTDPDGRGNLIRAVDSAGDPFLAFVSEADAKDSAEFHWNVYSIGCRPVRLK